MCKVNSTFQTCVKQIQCAQEPKPVSTFKKITSTVHNNRLPQHNMNEKGLENCTPNPWPHCVRINDRICIWKKVHQWDGETFKYGNYSGTRGIKALRVEMIMHFRCTHHPR